MHGLGNDFAIVDARAGDAPLDATLIQVMGDRHTGIGFDQLLTVEHATDPDCTFAYRIWNADGSASGQCGNGARCVAAWLHRAGALPLGTLTRLQSPSGAVGVRLRDALTVAVDMGEPVFSPAEIPFDAATAADSYALDVNGEAVTIGVVSMGNPHAVVEVDDVHGTRVARVGPPISMHPRFTAGCNAGFAQIMDRAHVRLRVHERGAGWTQACGTGACAAMAVLRRRDRVDADVAVSLPGGTLGIQWSGPGTALWMTGPAAFVYEGQWPLASP